MKLEGAHHITCITGDAPRNVEFYVGLLGMRLVKKSVNQDDPTVYHLFYADEKGSAGSDFTFFEYPGVDRGRAGAGMIHRIVFRIGSDDALRFWEDRLKAHGVEAERGDDWIRFDDPEGLDLELRVVDVPDAPLIADHTEIPREMALQGFHGVRAYTVDPERSRPLLEETMGMKASGSASFESRGDKRGSFYEYDVTNDRGLQAGGTVHHIAWASQIDDHVKWRERVIDGGMNPTPVIDRMYFKSIYYREPSGVLFEIATLGPGFTVDEPLDSLGQKLSVPPLTLEKLAKELSLPNDGSIEAFLHEKLTPLPDVGQWRPSGLREPVDTP